MDFGIQSTDTDSLPEAKDALVFLLVAINSRWKVPVAYFLINGLTGKEKSNMVNKCVEIVHTTGAVVVSLTFDGAAANVSMVKDLGDDLSPFNLKSTFLNSITNEPIFIFIDMCHVIKLLRNALGDRGYFLDGHNNYIKWIFFKDLVQLQEKSGLHAAAKLRREHINYSKIIMKVRLAIQTFSNSMAGANDLSEYIEASSVSRISVYFQILPHH